jgi:hypothetical protein
MPALLVFIALFGGLEVLDLAGWSWELIMGLGLAVLGLYAREKKTQRRRKARHG